ncbi:hypothetical protein N7541_000952 [Penicillium brevicompactum]|uniref:Uncharacterized protein n=1 Tax=Penicillium brevicompactum TaxID=5074 RepID=A0A9W9RVM0_PENBR|nr:hypothetical protein N7541_000952 [Penicillium brevicompactum]
MSSPQAHSSQPTMNSTTATNGAAPASSSQSYMGSGSGSSSAQSSSFEAFQRNVVGIGGWVPPTLNNSSQLDLQKP